tara:strand:+ start:34 stop:573 length:540 start_codon:yes stop_codon:yes gene_type:complete
MESCVRVYDDVISKQWCEDIIKSYENSRADNWQTWNKEFTMLEIRDLPEWQDTREKFVNLMLTYMGKFMKDVNIETKHFTKDIDIEHITIKKYTDNGKDKFGEHVDVIEPVFSVKRFLVFILYLSDCEGGETCIPRYNIKSQPKQGRLLMFPPYWTHPHNGEKVKKGNKYIMMSYLRMK